MEVDTKREIEAFIVAQYNKHYDLMLIHLNMSWKIPAFVFIIISAFVFSAAKFINDLICNPFVSGVALFFCALVFLVLLVHHRRNDIFVKEYGKVLREMEERYGIVLKAHHDIASKQRGINRISSTMCLTVFLILFSSILIFVSIYLVFISLQ